MIMSKEIVNYPIKAAQTEPVINIAGRDYVVMPFVQVFALSAERIAAYERYGKDGLGHELQVEAHKMYQDVLHSRLLDAVPFTVTEDESSNKNFRNFNMMIPVLLPVDTKEKWNDVSDHNLMRIAVEHDARMGNGEPYTFKVMKKQKE